jgi:DNA-binding IclR family transcriptional regulator
MVKDTCEERYMINAVDQRSGAMRISGILNAIADAGRPLSLSEIAERVGLPLATVHRYAKQLTDGCALEQLDDKRYRLGHQMWILGAAAHWERDLRQSINPVVSEIARVTQHAVSITVFKDDQLICLDRRWGRDSSVVICETGERLPLFETGAGRLLVGSECSRDQWDSLAAMHLHGREGAEQVQRQVAAEGSRGYAIARAEAHPKQLTLSVLVPTGLLGESMALSLLVPFGFEGSLDNMAPLAHKAAAAVGRAVVKARGDGSTPHRRDWHPEALSPTS